MTGAALGVNSSQAALMRMRGVARSLTGKIPVTLVTGIDLDIRGGEFLAITGPSGSGKSSLLYLLGLLDQPTAGSVVFQNTDTTRLSDDELAALRLRSLGFVFQFHFLLPEFSAQENVALPIRRLGISSRAEADDRASFLLDSLGMGDYLNRLPSELSGGQRQRVAIARALANNPVLLLADEPTGNLDSVSTANVQRILRELTQSHGCAVAVVTHDSAFAAAADRIIHLVDGKIVSGL